MYNNNIIEQTSDIDSIWTLGGPQVAKKTPTGCPKILLTGGADFGKLNFIDKT